VRILLERNDVNPDTADKYGQTPLWRAAQNGYEGVVRILLQRSDVNPDTADTLFGQTPLSRAAENGHEGIVRILLERNDVNPSTADILLGQTPLSRAAKRTITNVGKARVRSTERSSQKVQAAAKAQQMGYKVKARMGKESRTKNSCAGWARGGREDT